MSEDGTRPRHDEPIQRALHTAASVSSVRAQQAEGSVCSNCAGTVNHTPCAPCAETPPVAGVSHSSFTFVLIASRERHGRHGVDRRTSVTNGDAQERKDAQV